MKIIRTRQRPFLIVVDVFFTVLAWAGLLYLVINGLWPLLFAHDGIRIDASVFEALATLHIYMWVAVLNAVILIAWARYQHRKSRSFAKRRLPAPVVNDEGLSESFKLSGDRLERLRMQGSMTIHNDQDGDVSQVITNFYPVTAQRLPEPLASLEHPLSRLPAEDDDNREPPKRD